MSTEIEALVESYLRRKLEEKAGIIKELLDIQENSCTDAKGYDMYNVGIYNGLALGLAIVMNEEPNFYCMKEGKEDVRE